MTMDRMRRPARLCGRFLFLLFLISTNAGLGGGAQIGRAALAAPPARAVTISVPGAANALLLAPHQSTTLMARVADSHGTPLAGAQVTFLAPANGGGTFGRALYARVRADSQGLATARFITGGARTVYLLDAVVEGTTASTSFAVTTLAPGRAPALPADRARTIAATRLRLTAADAAARLYGPILLPAGTHIGPPQPVNMRPLPGATVLTQPSWLLWSDDQPDVGFAHPTRFVIVAAGHPAGAGAIQVSTETWWPELRWPGARRPIELRPAAVTTKVVGTRSFAQAAGHPDENRPNDCAIVIHGDLDWGIADGAATMKATLEGLGIHTYTPADVRSPRPSSDPAATFDDLKALITLVQSKPECRRVWLYIDTHGYRDISDRAVDGGFFLQSEPNPTKNTTWFVKYTDLARLLQPLANSGTTFTIIIDACYSGQAVEVMDAYGIPGYVLTSADDTHTSASRPWWVHALLLGIPADGGFFSNALSDALKNPSADTNHDGVVDPQEAYDWVIAHSSDPRLLNPMPLAVQTGHTHVVRSFPLAPSLIGGNVDTISIRRPPDVPLDSYFRFTLTFANPHVAGLHGYPAGEVFTILPNDGSLKVEVGGGRDGSTTVTADGYVTTAPSYRYHGTGSVEVGSRVRVQDVTVEVGQTVAGQVSLSGVIGDALASGQYPTASVHFSYESDIAIIAGDNLDRLRIGSPHTSGLFKVTGRKPGTMPVTVDAALPRLDRGTVWVRNVTFKVHVLPASGATASGDLVALPTSQLFTAPVGGLDSEPILIYNNGTEPITITARTIEPNSPFSFSDRSGCTPPVPMPENKSQCIMRIWFQPKAPGTFKGSVVLTYVKASGATGTITVPLTGITGDIATPVVTETGPITVTNYFPTATATPTALATVTPTATPTASATATPTATATIVITLTATPTATATRSSVGALPGALVTPDHLDFGTQQVGSESSPQQVAIRSTGTVPLQIFGPAVAGAGAQAFLVHNTDCPAQLDPNQQCGFTVTFAPSQPGTYAATLTVTDTAPGSPQQVQLAGSATIGPAPGAGGFTLSPDPVTVLGSFQRVSGSGEPASYADAFSIEVTGSAITITQSSTQAVYSGTIDALGNFTASNGVEQYSGQLHQDGTCPAVTNTVQQGGGLTTYTGQFTLGS